MSRARKAEQLNLLAAFGGYLQTIAGPLTYALSRRGYTLMEFVICLSQEVNKELFDKIAELLPSKEQIVGVAQKPFSAAKTFFARNPSVKFACIGKNFRAWFSDYACVLASGNVRGVLTLAKSMTDSEIIAQLGGESKVKVTLADVWELLGKQPNGEAGELLVNDSGNIFYVPSVPGGSLRAVDVGWGGGGWYVCALALGDSYWRDGSRVFARNS